MEKCAGGQECREEGEGHSAGGEFERVHFLGGKDVGGFGFGAIAARSWFRSGSR
jgi:hypothetical protein